MSALRDPCHQSSPAMLDHLQPVHLLNILLSAVMLAMIPRSTDPQQRIACTVAFAGWGGEHHRQPRAAFGLGPHPVDDRR